VLVVERVAEDDFQPTHAAAVIALAGLLADCLTSAPLGLRRSLIECITGSTGAGAAAASDAV
jgi:hypothetical protein